MPKHHPFTIHTVETVLLQTLIFLIPTNLAYHFYSQSAYINGRLSDYLLPKLYLSDLPLISLLIIFLYRIIKYRAPKVIVSNSTLLLFGYLLIRSLVNSNPFSSSWFVLKLIEYYCFGLYLTHTYTLNRFYQAVRLPLILSLFTQSIISFYQYINQRSIFGYYLLGEINLAAQGVAKATTPSGIKVLPYGTTAHPNVLSGFLAVGLLLLITSSQLSLKKYLKKAVNLLLTGLIVTNIWLTRSFSALSGIISTFLLIGLKNVACTLNVRLLFQITAGFTLLMSLLIYPIIYQASISTDNPSFYERYELNQVATTLFIQHPLFGVGPNLFTQSLPLAPLSRQQSYLLQPVHHGLLLITAETGLLGLILVVVNIISWFRATSLAKSPLSAFLPLFVLCCPILLLDHYPLTLQTGQLLLTLSLCIPLLKVYRSAK